jgi:hypothetical protein
MRTVPPPNMIGQPSVTFDLNSFEALIYNKGYDIIIKKAITCPCGGINHTPLLDCQNCRGTGWTFINPLKTKAIVTSINNETQFKEWSQEKIGTVSLTLYDSNRVAFMDKVIFENDYSYFQDLKIIRLSDSGDFNTGFVFLSYEAVEIKDVFIFKDSQSKLIRLTESQYHIDADNAFILKFDFDISTLINFNNSISIRYKYKNEYIVIDIPHDIRRSFITDSDGKQQKVNLPVNAIARKTHQQLIIPDYGGENVLNNSYK